VTGVLDAESSSAAAQEAMIEQIIDGARSAKPVRRRTKVTR